jgi:hypothetical protein
MSSFNALRVDACVLFAYRSERDENEPTGSDGRDDALRGDASLFSPLQGIPASLLSSLPPHSIPSMSDHATLNEGELPVVAPSTTNEKATLANDPSDESTPTLVAEEESTILTGRKLAIVFCALLASLLLIALDQTILATALPRIASDFNSFSQQGWISSSFILTCVHASSYLESSPLTSRCVSTDKRRSSSSLDKYSESGLPNSSSSRALRCSRWDPSCVQLPSRSTSSSSDERSPESVLLVRTIPSSPPLLTR